MARRFKRDNFLFPQDLRSVRGDVAARPVDAFQSADEGTIEQAPTRPFELQRPDRGNQLLDFAESLGIAARTAQSFSDQQYKQYSQEAEAQGSLLASQDAIKGNQRAFKQVISQTRKELGDETANKLMGLSPHLKRGFDQTRARNASLTYNASLQSAYISNPVIDEESGIRLHDLDVSDPLYQDWVQNFTQQFQESQGVSSLDPLAQSTFVPAVQDAQNRVNLSHDELRSKRKLLQFENETTEFITTALYELNGNVSIDPSTALQETANLITQQLDVANSLGYGGQDLQAVYAQVIESVIATATTTGNANLLDVLSIVEVGNPNNRSLLLQQASTSKYQQAVESARQSISDKEFQQGQRERTLRDQRREDSMREGIEAIALAGAFYESSGRTPESYESLRKIVDSVRVDAANDGWTTQLNSVLPNVLQESVDNQGVPVIDYAGMNALEASIVNEQVSGVAAQRRLNDLFASGALGQGEDAYANYQRINSRIKNNNDTAFNEFSSQVDSAAREYESVIKGRLGYTEDENGRIRTIKETLEAGGISPQEMVTLSNMSEGELDRLIADNAEKAALNQAIPFSSSLIQAMYSVVVGGVNPLVEPQPIDPGDIQRQVIDFKNRLFAANEQFKQENGRDMTPQERGDFIRSQSQSAINGQRGALPSSNPLSTTANPNTITSEMQDNFYSQVLGDVSSRTGNPRTDKILDSLEASKAFEHFILTDRWHPEIVELSELHGITPMELVQRQAALNGVEVRDDLALVLGLPTAAKPNDALPFQSVYSSNSSRDISKDYSGETYKTFTKFFIDDYSKDKYSPGSYDFTFYTDSSPYSREFVNVPAPFDGVVTDVVKGCKEGDHSCGSGYGNSIEIKGRDGTILFIGHLKDVYLNKGDRFVKGQAIMKQGNTGHSFGAHLHVEVFDKEYQLGGSRIANREITRPIIDDWISYVESGEFLKPKTSSSPRSEAQTLGGLVSNGKELYGHKGYDVATDLVTVEVESDGWEWKLAKPAADSFKKMKNDAAYEGINLDIGSAFRDYSLQEQLWNDSVKRKGSEAEAARTQAPPGYSQHHTGLAIDFSPITNDFQNTPQYQWLKNNARRYGFELSFPEGNTQGVAFEPWQWVYTGNKQSSSSSNSQARNHQDFFNSISSSASRLGVDPIDLATVLAQESSLDVNAGGSGGAYQGLFQASSDVRQRYGVYAGQPYGEQLAALEAYLYDRGYRPGMGIEGLYASILVGNPWNEDSNGNYNPSDSNGTSVLSALENWKRPGGKREEAMTYFGL